VLRKNLPPLDAYLADAATLDAVDFLARYVWPVLIIPEPDPEVLAQISRPNTVAYEDVPTMMMPADPMSPLLSGASLDALCLEVRPKKGGSTESITLGRSPDVDVVLIDETISRVHASIAWDKVKERAILTDLGGKNGTHVDDIRLSANGRISLMPGSVITFGALVTRYHSPRSFYAWLSTGAPRAGAAPGVWPGAAAK
jgi:FHA domain-containing protein